MKKRTLSFCSTATDKPTTATCFLGHGQQEWDEHVQKWSNFYYESMLAEGKHYHHERRMWAGAAGGYVGGKAGTCTTWCASNSVVVCVLIWMKIGFF